MASTMRFDTWENPTGTRSLNIASATPGLTPILPSGLTVSTGTAAANNVGTVTFTGVTSLDLSNVFSSAYSSYKVIINITGGSVTNDVNLYLRMPGATSGYSTQYFRFYNTLSSASRDAGGTTAFWLGPAGYSTWAAYEVLIANPNVAVKTTFNSYGGGDNAATERMIQGNVGFLNNTTQYTGLQMYVGSGNVTGTIIVYGLNG